MRKLVGAKTRPDQRIEAHLIGLGVQGERAPEPVPGFGVVATGVPEIAQRGGELRVGRGIGVAGPVERGAQVVVFRFEPVKPFEGRGPGQRLRAGLGKAGEVGEVTPPHPVGQSGFDELFARVLLDRFE
jgi:hypothetical protein